MFFAHSSRFFRCRSLIHVHFFALRPSAVLAYFARAADSASYRRMEEKKDKEAVQRNEECAPAKDKRDVKSAHITAHTS